MKKTLPVLLTKVITPLTIAAKPVKLIHIVKSPDSFTGGKWTHKIERRVVFVTAVAGGHALVRRPYCLTYACSVSELDIPREGDDLRTKRSA